MTSRGPFQPSPSCDSDPTKEVCRWPNSHGLSLLMEFHNQGQGRGAEYSLPVNMLLTRIFFQLITISYQELRLQLWNQLENCAFSFGFRELLDFHNMFCCCSQLVCFCISFLLVSGNLHLFLALVDSIKYRKLPGQIMF